MITGKEGHVDPILSTIGMALATGAAASLKETAGTVVYDCYAGLKAYLGRRYAHVDVTPLEAAPQSRARRSVVEEDLNDAGAKNDHELLDLARRLLDAIAAHSPASAQVAGVELEDVKAASANIHDILSSGSGVVMRRATFDGHLDIGNVSAGGKVAKKA